MAEGYFLYFVQKVNEEYINKEREKYADRIIKWLKSIHPRYENYDFQIHLDENSISIIMMYGNNYAEFVYNKTKNEIEFGDVSFVDRYDISFECFSNFVHDAIYSINKQIKMHEFRMDVAATWYLYEWSVTYNYISFDNWMKKFHPVSK